MKRYNCRKAGLTGLVCLGVCISAAGGQQAAQEREYYWYCHDKKLIFDISTRKMAVIFEDDAADTRKQDLAGSDAAIARLAETRDSKGRVQMVELNPGLAKPDVEAVVARAGSQPGVRFATPVLVLDGGEFVPNGEIIVKFARDATDAEIAALGAKYGATIATKFPHGKSEADPRKYVLRVTNPRQDSPLDVANLYHAEPRVLWAEPNGFCLSMNLCYPNDPYFASQWSLKQTNDCDIDADQAWGIQQGSSDVDITIAVLDTGLYFNHPDLNCWLNEGESVPELRKTDGVDNDGNGYVDDWRGWDFYNNSNDPSPDDNIWGPHGTGCAGVAAAKTDNNAGIAGVCGGAHCMALQINTHPTSVSLFAPNDKIAAAFDYARMNGAHVLTNSWGTSSTTTLSAAIDEAIEDAKTLGRGGKGCPVVFAANNTSTTLKWPAFLSAVIAVGGSDTSDVRWWYSNFGPELDVAAPTEGIWSTSADRAGLPIYATGGGTSMATPHVAGVAGLLILKNSMLTANQIQAIIQFSADDKGDTGRDDYYGYGRLNACNALTLPTGLRTLFNGSSNLHKGSLYHEDGHLVVEDKVTSSATSGQLTPSSSDVWVLRDSTSPTPLVIARLTSAGTLYLKGAWYEKEASLSPPSGSPLIFRNSSSAVTAYIDLNGNLKVKGRIFMGNDPDRSSSQGK